MSNYKDDEQLSGQAKSTLHNVTIFRPYPFEVGQKITIERGPRRGDWQVIGVDERKVKLRCPVTQREVEWNRFCYFVEERDGVEWPHCD
jgi:hypothetical protein